MNVAGRETAVDPRLAVEALERGCESPAVAALKTLVDDCPARIVEGDVDHRVVAPGRRGAAARLRSS